MAFGNKDQNLKRKENQKMSGSMKKSSNQLEMEDLLNSKDAPKLPKTGEVIEGGIIEMSNNAIYVDLGPVGTGIIYGYGKETFSGLSMFKDLKSGSPIAAKVVDIENEDGYVELSLKQASVDLVWKELEKKMEENTIITTKVLEANKGGLMIKVNGVVGFLPASQLSSENYPRVSDGDKNKILSLLAQLVGKSLKVKIIGLDKKEEKLIVSEKATKEKEEKERVAELEVGSIINGEISGIVDFGAFVKFNDSLEGLVHISELAWKLIDDPRKLFNVGQKVKCKIIGIDNSRISLSIKALEEDPWKMVNKKYQVGKTVRGEVTKINPFGAFVQLDKDIHGLVHVSKLDEKGTKKFVVGETYDFDIVSIEPSEHRLGLKPCLPDLKDENKDKDKDKDENKDKNSLKGKDDKKTKRKPKKEKKSTTNKSVEKK